MSGNPSHLRMMSELLLQLLIIIKCCPLPGVQLNKTIYNIVTVFLARILRPSNPEKVIWQLSSFTGGERLQEPLRALFQVEHVLE
jgi:hypothetical protein